MLAFATLEKIGERAVSSAKRGDADSATMDVSKECAAAMATLCLAQAQKCVFDKAARDGKSPGVLAKLARQAHLFYAETEATSHPNVSRARVGLRLPTREEALVPRGLLFFL